MLGGFPCESDDEGLSDCRETIKSATALDRHCTVAIRTFSFCLPFSWKVGAGPEGAESNVSIFLFNPAGRGFGAPLDEGGGGDLCCIKSSESDSDPEEILM